MTSPIKRYKFNHCHFKILNSNGRCIATCHWNWQEDCIGRNGKTMDMKIGREVPLAMTKIGK
jgi:hypothetical protein